MRTRIGLIGGVLVLLIGAGIAALAYQAGVTQGAASATSGSGAATAVVYGPWFWGFGGFHILGILFGLFILFLVARVVLGVLFWGGPGHWGRHGRGHWGEGLRGRPDRDAFFAEMHRRYHEQDKATGATAGGSDAGAGTPPRQDPGA